MNKGFIKITDPIYKQHWNMVAKIMKDFRPFHIEFRPYENDVWYFYGESKKFDHVEEGELIPEYMAIFTKKNNRWTFRFERV